MTMETPGQVPERPPLAELVEFPCDYVFKAFGPAGEPFLQAVQGAAAGVVSVPPGAITTRPSSGGTYQCVSVSVPLQNPEQLKGIYVALRAVAGLKYLL